MSAIEMTALLKNLGLEMKDVQEKASVMGVRGSLEMPNSDPRDGFIYLPLTPMIHPYILSGIAITSLRKRELVALLFVTLHYVYCLPWFVLLVFRQYYGNRLYYFVYVDTNSDATGTFILYEMSTSFVVILERKRTHSFIFQEQESRLI